MRPAVIAALVLLAACDVTPTPGKVAAEAVDLRFAEDYCPAEGNRHGSLQFVRDKASISGFELCELLHDGGQACSYSIAEWREYKNATKAIEDCDCKRSCEVAP